jgi:AcrR family transcriptional regulator
MFRNDAVSDSRSVGVWKQAGIEEVDVAEQRTTEQVRPGRRRSGEADRAILLTTLELLGEVGYAGLTLNEVIARSGVSSATLYRRWPSKAELVTAAIASLGTRPPRIDTGALARDLAAYIDYLGAEFAHPAGLAGAWADGARFDPAMRDVMEETFTAPRRELLRDILKTAHGRGEIAAIPPIGDCWSYVSGPIHHRMHIRNKPFTRIFSRDTAVMVTAGLVALAASRAEHQ